jgi:hypothetical protein
MQRRAPKHGRVDQCVNVDRSNATASRECIRTAYTEPFEAEQIATVCLTTILTECGSSERTKSRSILTRCGVDFALSLQRVEYNRKFENYVFLSGIRGSGRESFALITQSTMPTEAKVALHPI